MFVAA
jgi:hypothetical protein